MGTGGRNVGWLSATCAAACVVAGVAAPVASATASTSFTTSGQHVFTVPTGVTSVHVVAVGGKGGDGAVNGSGAFGGTATADLAVTPGETLYAEVGGNGANGNGLPTGSSDGAGGANGGGAGGSGGPNIAAGGGGASDVRTSPASVALTSADSRLVVAGGGGGAGHGPIAFPGGAGGGDNGADGVDGATTCATGGTQSAGGTASDGGGSGARGIGGTGATMYFSTVGGGGGGGFFGGAGGGNGMSGCVSGGAGGSGHFAIGTTNTSFGTDTTGVPSITFTYVAPPTISITAPKDGGGYYQDATVIAHYTCTAGAGTTLSSCVGPVDSGVKIDTNSIGRHTFTVIATDADGGTTTSSVSYRVISPFPPGKPTLSGAGAGSGHFKAHKGATFSFTLTAAGRVTFSFTRQLTGRKVKGHCVTPTRKNRHRPKCTISRSAGKATVNGRAGSNTLKLGAGRLKPGSYVVTITVTDTSGHVTSRKTLRFTVSA